MENQVQINIEKKPKVENVEKITVNSPDIVYKLKEVQAIKDAVQEHLLFIGLDKNNHLRNITFIGIGSTTNVFVDSKSILRTALINACEGVILVHNHPSNSLKPSFDDKKMSNHIYKFLNIFNIKLIDHVIVTEENYTSMLEHGYIDKEYKDKDTEIVDNIFLIEENIKLKEKIKTLQNRKSKNKEIER